MSSEYKLSQSSSSTAAMIGESQLKKLIAYGDFRTFADCGLIQLANDGPAHSMFAKA
jgi:hypothetical protein